MTDQTVDLAVFAPHPDDAEIGCGGLLLLARAQGLRTAIVDLSAGEMGTRGTVQTRAAEAAAAARILETTHRICLDLPDTEIGQSSKHQDMIISCLRTLKPRVIAVPHAADRHPDHAATGALVERCRQLAAIGAKSTGDPHRVDMLLRYGVHAHFDPTFVLDVTPVWERRMQAVRAFGSQFGTDPDQTDTPLSGGDFLEVIAARARYYGAMVGARHGEAYQADRPLKFGDLGFLHEPMATTHYRSAP